MNEKIYNSVPVNKTAGVVTSKQFETDDIKFIPKGVRSNSPLPTRNGTFSRKEHDLTGKRYGNLIVVGLSHIINNNKRPSLWVVKCDCGYYELRKRNSLLRGTSIACTKCILIINKFQSQKELILKDFGQGDDERIRYKLKNKNGNSFTNKNTNYRRQLIVGDIMEDIHGNKDTLTYVSNARLEFEKDIFNEGSIVYLVCGDEENEFRKTHDLRNIDHDNLKRLFNK